MTDVLQTEGKTPEERDRLKRVVMKGESRSIQSFRSDVGRGSEAELLLGRERRMLQTKSEVTGEKVSKVQLGGAALIFGEGKQRVESLTEETFWEKKLCRSDADSWLEKGGRPRPSSELIERQALDGERESVFSLLRQKEMRLIFRRAR